MVYKDVSLDSLTIDTSSWDNFKDKVFIRLINKKLVDAEESEYEGVITSSFMDLYKIFYIREIDRSSKTVKCYYLKKDDMKRFNVKFKKIERQATENLSHDRKLRIELLTEAIIKDSSDFGPIVEKSSMASVMMSQGSGATIVDKDEESNLDNVLSITNTLDVFGASYMASVELLDRIYNRFRENFYIVTISQHKALCIRDNFLSKNGKINRLQYEDDLLDMEDDLNSKVKNWKDILSYRIYYYLGDDGKKLFSIKE